MPAPPPDVTQWSDELRWNDYAYLKAKNWHDTLRNANQSPATGAQIATTATTIRGYILQDAVAGVPDFTPGGAVERRSYAVNAAIIAHFERKERLKDDVAYPYKTIEELGTDADAIFEMISL